MHTEDGLALERELEKSATALTRAVAGLTEGQAATHPVPGSWSALEIIEHIAIVDQVFSARIGQTEPSAEKIVNDEREQSIIQRMVGRETRISAPEMTHPRGKFATLEEALSKFLEVRKQVSQILEEKEETLRYLPVKHPAFGVISGYEAFLVIAGHTNRHVAQILERDAAAAGA